MPAQLLQHDLIADEPVVDGGGNRAHPLLQELVSPLVQGNERIGRQAIGPAGVRRYCAESRLMGRIVVIERIINIKQESLYHSSEVLSYHCQTFIILYHQILPSSRKNPCSFQPNSIKTSQSAVSGR